MSTQALERHLREYHGRRGAWLRTKKNAITPDAMWEHCNDHNHADKTYSSWDNSWKLQLNKQDKEHLGFINK